MIATYLLFAELLISITVSLLVLYVLADPLVKILSLICPVEQAAIFWLSYTKIVLTIAPLVLVLSVDMLSHLNDPMENLRLALIAALGGVLIGLHLVGKRLEKFETTLHNSGSAS
jgi:hypothetical protein